MKVTGWQLVVIIGLVLAAIVTLSALGQDTAALIGLGTLLFAGLGLIAGQQNAIKDQTNGNTTKLLSMVEQLAHRLADATPPAPLDPPPPHPVVIDGDLVDEHPPTTGA